MFGRHFLIIRATMWDIWLDQESRKERNLEHPHCSCCNARPGSFLSPAWRDVTSKSWGKRLLKDWYVAVQYFKFTLHSIMQRKKQHEQTITTQQCTTCSKQDFAVGLSLKQMVNAIEHLHTVKASNNLHRKAKDD